MSRPIEDYGMIGDTRTAALVAVDGAIEWLCLPRFDSGACFAALLGGPEHGRWTMAPRGRFEPAGRRYRDNTLVLETRLRCAEGEVRIVDCMPVGGDYTDVLRRVEGVEGRVPMRTELNPRFDYGSVLPWLRREGDRVHALAGPDHLVLDADTELHDAGDNSIVADFSVAEGDAVEFRLAWSAPGQNLPEHLDAGEQIERTSRWWRDWASRCEYQGKYSDAVLRSLITLKALTYAPSGGVIAAPTTSLPEWPGGERNWDYRYCWIRDATFTLMALLGAGYEEEARAWREWLLRAVAGSPSQLQIIYGPEGERRLPELELDWLPGYGGARPVREGNGAAGQFQLDIFGELMDALHQARTHGIPPDPDAWEMQRQLLDYLESNWREPDHGVWETRGTKRHFTHSKVMAWAALDRAVKGVEKFGLDGPVDHWKRVRAEIFDEVCERGFDTRRGTFTEYYGSQSLDAALLALPNVGFLPASDERMVGTVAAIERELGEDGLIRRFPHESPSSAEGAFLMCTFWLADNYLLRGDVESGRALFERLLGLRGDLGLLSEEYLPSENRLIGNFPQALTHIALVNTALNLEGTTGPAHRRAAS